VGDTVVRREDQFIDSDTEQVYFSVPEAQAADIDRAVTAAKEAFDHGPWPWLSHAQRADYLRALGAELKKRSEEIGQTWPREAGVLASIAQGGGAGAENTFNAYAALAETYPWEEPAKPSVGQFGLLVREPVGVVGAIIPWNGPIGLISNKIAPALLAGCTVILKNSPEAPGEGYLLAEAAEAVGLPAGVINVVTADREVSELLVRDPRVDKITFTGSTAAGGGSPRSAVSGSPGSPWSSVASPPPSSSTTRTSSHRPHPVGGRVQAVRPGLLLADPDRGSPGPAR
jgi:aldehyde dehydrogenase (NAD+)